MADPGYRGRIVTIPPGLPFLDTLARALLDGELPGPASPRPSPIGLAQATLLLPSRRTTRAVQDAFLRAAGGQALLLPNIRPLSEGVEDLSLLAGAASLQEFGAGGLDIPPAVTELQRRLLLMQLVQRWSQSLRAGGHDTDAVQAAGAATAAQAAHLAAELGRLMDFVESEGASLSNLATLVPEDFSEHWGQTLAFLDIALQAWPAVLAADGRLGPVERQVRILAAEAARWRALAPRAPVVVAGITSATPAMLEVIRAVLASPHGALVLPGLDHALDAETFATLPEHPDHPQHGFALLLRALAVDRAAVGVLGPALPARAVERAAFVTEALRPAASTDRWHGYVRAADRGALRQALAGIERIDTPTAQDEAEVIALRLRAVLETPGKTAALVTPDRLLARRVVARLAAAGIDIDDSAGRPFAKTPPGAFLDLILAVVETDFAPAPTTALLKHPLTRLGLPVGPARRAARHLELAVFRAPYLGRGLDGLEAGLEIAAREAVGDSDLPVRRPVALRRLSEADWAAARDLIARLRTAVAPLTGLFEAAAPHDLTALALAHVSAAEALSQLVAETAAGTARPAAPLLYQGEAGAAAQRFFTGLLDPDLSAPRLTAREYPDVFRQLVGEEVVRPRGPRHPRLAIRGPIEARLQQPDLVVLGGMNDATWPQAADPGPWLNRPMRASLGLPAPEVAIGRAAHDMTQLLGAPEVVLTRAQKVDGVPTVPSRWLLRIDALLGGLGLADALRPVLPWLAWARQRDRYTRTAPVAAPAPCPPIDRRPRRLAVTEIERWMANPYAIYARHVLRLEALPALGTAPGAALKGAILHDALGRFARRHPTTLPPDIAAELDADVARVLAAYAAHPRVAAFWRPRLHRFCRWFAETEPARRTGVLAVVTEITGRHVFAGPAGPFTLTARADRIDTTPAGYVLIDYKTGQVPSAKAVESGRAPQLPLEALIAASGGFKGLPKADAVRLHYIRATGGTPPGEDRVLKLGDLAAVVATAHDGVEGLITDYDDPDMPYRALRRASFATAYPFDEFAHLARVREWVGDETDGSDEPGGDADA